MHKISTYMKNRKERLPIIIDLLTNKIIRNQDQLLKELNNLGFSVTQATLSRDLKHLRTSKVSTGIGGYRYVVPRKLGEVCDVDGFNGQHSLRPSIQSISRSSNIIIIKTMSTHAIVLSQAFDAVSSDILLASIPVGDTLMLVLRPDVSELNAYELLTSVMTADLVAPYSSALG